MGVMPVVTLPEGTHNVTLSVDDGNGGMNSDSVQIEVAQGGACPAGLVLADLLLPGTQTLEATATVTLGPHRQPRKPQSKAQSRARKGAMTNHATNTHQHRSIPAGSDRHEHPSRRLQRPIGRHGINQRRLTPAAQSLIGGRLNKHGKANEPDWLRERSALGNLQGDVRLAQGDLSGALQAYGESLTVRRRLGGGGPIPPTRVGSATCHTA